MSKFTRKRSIVLGLIATLAIAAGAIAYLTTYGTGSGDGATTADTAPLTLTSSVGDLTNIGDSKTITVYAQNGHTSPQAVEDVKLTVTPKATTGCPAGSFTIGAANSTSASSNTFTATSNVNVPGGQTGTTKTAIATAKVFFNNDANAAQDACLQGYNVALASTNAPS